MIWRICSSSLATPSRSTRIKPSKVGTAAVAATTTAPARVAGRARCGASSVGQRRKSPSTNSVSMSSNQANTCAKYSFSCAVRRFFWRVFSLTNWRRGSPRPAAFSDRLRGQIAQGGILVPGPSQSQSLTAQQKHLTRSLF